MSREFILEYLLCSNVDFFEIVSKMQIWASTWYVACESLLRTGKGQKKMLYFLFSMTDSGSSILGGGIRENAIEEALYATIPDTPNTSVNETGTSRSNSQSRSQPLYSPIPSMTSPPPTYDVAVAKTWQVRCTAVYYLLCISFSASRWHRVHKGNAANDIATFPTSPSWS